MNFPVLSVIVFTPLVAAALILLMPADRKNEVRVIALAAAVFALAVAPPPFLPAPRISLIESIFLRSATEAYFRGITFMMLALEGMSSCSMRL